MANEIQFNVDAALEKLGQLVQAHGQQAMDAAVGVEQMSGIDALVGCVGWSITAAGAVFIARWLLRLRKEDEDWIDNPFPAIGAVLLGIGALAAFFLGVLCPLFSVWTWVAIFNPKLALAHDIMQRLAGIG